MKKRATVSNRPIRLIPVLVKFRPGDLVSLGIENRVMGGALLARGKLAWLLTSGEVYEVYL